MTTTFIKMKPTIVNCLFGGALLGGLLFGEDAARLMSSTAPSTWTRPAGAN